MRPAIGRPTRLPTTAAPAPLVLLRYHHLLPLLGLLALLLAAACAPTPEAPPGELASTAGGAGSGVGEPDLEALMARARIPGLAVAVIEDGEIARVELAGVAEAGGGEPVGPETLFEAASLSKPVFATVVLRLAERGELDLDRPLSELLPYERIDHDPRAAALTARLVLSHRTGLPNWGGERLDLAFDPGERFGYSGEGYVYLQRVVEAVTGESLDALARREVFAPLGMERSRFSWPEGEEPPLAVPHDGAGRPQPKRQPREANAAASLHTTAEDYARFVVAWTGGELLSAASRAGALAPAARMRGDETATEQPPEVAGRIAWGLGWGLQLPPEEGGEAPIARRSIAWHWGDNGPAKAFVAFRPESGDGVVYFANSHHGLAIGRALVAGVVGDMEPAFTWAGYESHRAPGFAERLEGLAAEAEGRYREAAGRFRAAVAADPGDESSARRIEWLEELVRVEESPVEVRRETLAGYAGRYGPRLLSLGEEGLRYRRDGRPEYRMIPLSPTLFALEGMVDFRLEVVVDEAGEPTKLVGHYLDGERDEHSRGPTDG